MIETLLVVAVVLLFILLALTVVLLLRRGPAELAAIASRVEGLAADHERMERSVREEMTRGRSDAAAQARALREEVAGALDRLGESLRQGQSMMARGQGEQLAAFAQQLTALGEGTERRLEALRGTVADQLRAIQDDNAAQLEKMRETVDERLQGTLEARLGESFRAVSERLEQVQRGLGEMQALASGVGDLKRVLTNVKTRGTWGEVQLGTLLEQALSPSQFATNVETREHSGERVEFAVRLPGKDPDRAPVWLPIDAKFPQEDYQRLIDAAERGDAEAVEGAARQLENRVKVCAREIHDKYLDPPNTTDFGILFLPTEGLYAEVLRRPGLAEILQRDHRVLVAGPTTLWAILNSLQMGFRTLAIERRSSEVWTVLAAVKTHFGRFGELLGSVQKKLQEATNKMDAVSRQSRTIERKLRDVQELPANRSAEDLLLAAPLDLLDDDEPAEV
ncbi:MAG TPA: DNA recombination protein RmuC [Vicinamibacterales bacterium]|nr:DNA recombination protein RmuC [Acidobacteriota bacterium]HOC17103.1 DNA recombination protein RmuC [Vicinamibacterales bacterium]